jgi:phosphoribosylaminoimidazole carboxylase PurE protein
MIEATSTCFVVILMGSKADLAHAQAVANFLAEFGVAFEMRVASAHKTPARLLEIVREYESDPRPHVFVTIAGRSNALSGMVDANVAAPVVACPPYSERFAGADVYSSLRMPSGVGPATVLEPEGAALMATKVLALGEPGLREKLLLYQKSMRDRLALDDEDLQRAESGNSEGR